MVAILKKIIKQFCMFRCYVDNSNNCSDSTFQEGSPYNWSCQACQGDESKIGFKKQVLKQKSAKNIFVSFVCISCLILGPWFFFILWIAPWHLDLLVNGGLFQNQPRLILLRQRSTRQSLPTLQPAVWLTKMCHVQVLQQKSLLISGAYLKDMCQWTWRCA